MVRFHVADGKKTQELVGGKQGDAKPGTELRMSLKRLPSLLPLGVRNQDMLSFRPDALKKWGFVRNECQGPARSLLREFGARFFTQGQPMRTSFGNQHPSARVGNQLGQRAEQCIQNAIHVKVLRKRKSGLT